MPVTGLRMESWFQGLLMAAQLLGVEKEHQQLFQLCADDARGTESNIFCSAVQLCACSWKQGGL